MIPWLGGGVGPMKSHADSFGLRPFAVGSVTGLRAWRVNKDHMLTPTSMVRYVWLPGENHAECLTSVAKIPADHRLIGLNCTCGFYAYYDGRCNYATQVTVTGIIEGYGCCVVGTQGFRCEKAVIRALVRPAAEQKLTYAKADTELLDFDLLSSHYPDVPVFLSVEAALEAFPLTPQSVD